MTKFGWRHSSFLGHPRMIPGDAAPGWNIPRTAACLEGKKTALGRTAVFDVKVLASFRCLARCPPKTPGAFRSPSPAGGEAAGPRGSQSPCARWASSRNHAGTRRGNRALHRNEARLARQHRRSAAARGRISRRLARRPARSPRGRSGPRRAITGPRRGRAGAAPRPCLWERAVTAGAGGLVRRRGSCVPRSEGRGAEEGKGREGVAAPGTAWLPR